MKAVLLLLFTICILSSTAYAETFTISEDNSLTAPTAASRQLDITIETTVKDSFSVGLSGEKPWMTLSDTSFTLEADESKNISLYASPSADTTIGTYKVVLKIKSISTNVEEKKALFISVVKGDVLEIEKIVVTGDLRPTGNVDVDVHVRNFRTTTATNVHVDGFVYSTYQIFAFSENIGRLDPEETTVVSSSFKLNKYAPPGKYYVSGRLVEDGETVEDVRQDFSVVKGPVMNIKRDVGLTFIGITNKITASNNGNDAASVYDVTEPVSEFEGVFFFGDQPTHTNDNYVWIFENIQPGSSAVVAYSINYLPLIVLIIVIVLFVWYLFFKMNTLRVKKYIMQKKMIKEGEEFTVGVEINNALRGKIEDVVLHDFVPSVFSVKDAYGPSAKKKRKGVGTGLTWNIKELKSGEERIFSYKIIPMFGVQGSIKLPPAKVSFKYKKKLFRNKSWSAMIGIKPQPEK